MYGDVLNGFEIFNLFSCGFSHDTLKSPSDPFISPEILFIINIYKCLKIKINLNSYCMEVILKKKEAEEYVIAIKLDDKSRMILC